MGEDYLDWFFLSKFGKGLGYWRSLPEGKLQAMVAFEQEFDFKKRKEYFTTWSEMFKQMFGK